MTEGKIPQRKPAGDVRLDALLGAWPTAERTAIEWDESAERVLSRVDSSMSSGRAVATSSVSDEDLLRPPLPASPGEGSSSPAIEPRAEGTAMTTSSRERDRDRASFRDLAKMASLTAPPSASAVRAAPSGQSVHSSDGDAKSEREENSGVINLAALVANEEARVAPAPAVAAASTAPETVATLRSSGTPFRPGQRALVGGPVEKKGTPWVAIGGVLAAAAVAAGVFVGMQRSGRPATVAANTPASPPAATSGAPFTGARPGSAASPSPTDDHGVDPASLPPAATGALALHGPPSPLAAKGPPAAAPGKNDLPPAPAAPPAVAAVPTPAAPAASGDGNLEALMQQAAGVRPGAAPATTAAPGPDPALPAPGSVPLKPSQGAIQGALGAALPGARACLGPDDPISHATIVFSSDGSVQSVGVSGGASGKPAESCIRAALSKARVTPFAQPTFTATATVRPN